MAVHELYSSNSNQYGHRTFIVPDTGVTIAMTLVGAGDPLAEYYNAVTGRHACISRRKQGMHEVLRCMHRFLLPQCLSSMRALLTGHEDRSFIKLE